MIHPAIGQLYIANRDVVLEIGWRADRYITIPRGAPVIIIHNKKQPRLAGKEKIFNAYMLYADACHSVIVIFPYANEFDIALFFESV